MVQSMLVALPDPSLMNDQVFRTLTTQERQALEKILSLDFRGRANLIKQLDAIEIRQQSDDIFELRQRNISYKTRPKTYGLPIQAIYTDSDGLPIYVDLFVDEFDWLYELEIWKPDGSPVQTSFATANLITQYLSSQHSHTNR